MSIATIQHTLADRGLVRSDRAVAGGVCAGLAERHNISVWALRIAVVVASSVVHVLPLLYLAGWLLMPRRGTVPAATGATRGGPTWSTGYVQQPVAPGTEHPVDHAV